MAFRNQLGSLSALSLSGSTEMYAAIGGAAITVTIAAATFIYEEIKSYQEKKHREEIEKVNELHDRFLARISIPDNNEIKGFPEIYRLLPHEKSSSAQSIHFTDDQIKDMGTTLPIGVDVDLSKYLQLIQCAIKKLRAYYFRRTDRNDVTSGVLSYLMYMLESKCINFEGYDYDIAYLDALREFVRAYGSSKGSEVTQHFSRLNPVYVYLTSALDELIKHKAKLSLGLMSNELRASCRDAGEQLITIFVKMVTKNCNWDEVDDVVPQELKQGVLSKQYIKAEWDNKFVRYDKKKLLSKSLYFESWIKALAKYYLEAFDSETSLSETQVLSPDLMFKIPDLQRFVALTKAREAKKINKSELTELAELDKDIKDITLVFGKCENFVTRKLDLATQNDLPKFIPVKAPDEVINRTIVLKNFATLIHEIISLQYLCTHLLKSIKQLGEIYVKNPHHFVRIFGVLEALCDRIKADIDANQNAFIAIQKSDKNEMQLAKKEVILDQINKILDTTSTKIVRLGSNIKAYRDMVAKHKIPGDPTLQSVKHEMFEVISLITDMYHMDPAVLSSKPSTRNLPPVDTDKIIPPVQKKASKIKKKESVAVVPPANHPSPTAAVATPQAPVLPPVVNQPALANGNEPDATDEISHDSASSTASHASTDTQPSASGSPTITSAPNQAAATIVDEGDELTQLDALIGDLNTRILQIQAEDKPADTNANAQEAYQAEMKAYQDVYNHLVALQQKAKDLTNEEGKTIERAQKASATLQVTLSLSHTVLNYLDLKKEDRLSSADKFAQAVQAAVNNENMKVIDRHYYGAGQTLFSVSHLNVFRTDTRKKLNSLLAICNSIANMAIKPSAPAVSSSRV